MRPRTVFVLVIAMLFLGGCASNRRSETRSLTISGGDGNLSITLSSAAARSLLEDTLGTTLECDGELDEHLERMLQTLDRRGRRGRYTLRGEDATIHARRHGDNLLLEVRGVDNGAELDVTLPWSVAECLLGGSMTLDSVLDSGSIRVVVRGSNGGTFDIGVE